MSCVFMNLTIGTPTIGPEMQPRTLASPPSPLLGRWEVQISHCHPERAQPELARRARVEGPCVSLRCWLQTSGAPPSLLVGGWELQISHCHPERVRPELARRARVEGPCVCLRCCLQKPGCPTLPAFGRVGTANLTLSSRASATRACEASASRGTLRFSALLAANIRCPTLPCFWEGGKPNLPLISVVPSGTAVASADSAVPPPQRSSPAPSAPLTQSASEAGRVPDEPVSPRRWFPEQVQRRGLPPPALPDICSACRAPLQ